MICKPIKLSGLVKLFQKLSTFWMFFENEHVRNMFFGRTLWIKIFRIKNQFWIFSKFYHRMYETILSCYIVMFSQKLFFFWNFIEIKLFRIGYQLLKFRTSIVRHISHSVQAALLWNRQNYSFFKMFFGEENCSHSTNKFETFQSSSEDVWVIQIKLHHQIIPHTNKILVFLWRKSLYRSTK